MNSGHSNSSAGQDSTRGELKMKERRLDSGSCSKTSDDSRDVRISKKLSTILRHRAVANGLHVRPDGFVQVADILALPNFFHVCLDDIRRVVNSDKKGRFSISADDTLIRANQGHTLDVIQDIALLRKLNEDEIVEFGNCVIHGTYLRCLSAILKEGLRRMARRHVHFAAGLPGESGVISGMRNSADVLIYVDLRRAIESGVPFFISENNVILSPGVDWGGNVGVVPPCYFSSVTERRTGNNLLATNSR